MDSEVNTRIKKLERKMDELKEELELNQKRVKDLVNILDTAGKARDLKAMQNTLSGTRRKLGMPLGKL